MFLLNLFGVGSTERTASQFEFINAMGSLSTFSENAPPPCLFLENPNRPVTLWDILVKDFRAHEFCTTSSQIAQLFTQIRYGIMPGSESWGVIGEAVRILEKDCIALELNATLAQIQRVQETIARGNAFDVREFSNSLMEILVRVVDELKARKLYALEPDKERYLIDSQFAAVVLDRFPEAGFDMSEAARCFAFGRDTACVYHLMRVTEYGLQAIGKQLGIKDDRPNWEPIIAKIDSELRKPYKERQYKGMADFLAHVSAHLNAVKLAWRNRVMHVEKKHAPEEAREIYNATAGLMRYVAENLPREKSAVVRSIRDIMKR